MKKQLPFALLFFVYFFIVGKCEGVRTVSIISDKAVLFGNDTLTLTASLSGFTNGEVVYVKGAFYQDGTSSYFGYTQNGSDWIKNGDATTNQRQVTIGNWDGNLVIKSDFDDSDYKGEGDYKLKLGFYYTTSGGNLSSVNWSTNAVTVTINNPDPTPTPTLLPTPTYSPTPTPKLPTPTVASKIVTPTSKISVVSNLSPTDMSATGAPGGDVLADSTDNTSPTPTTKVLGVQKHLNFVPFIFFSFGGILFAVCGILLFRQYRLGKIE